MKQSQGASGLPTGTVTFMFTDIEGSTSHAQSLDPNVLSALLGRHHDVLRSTLSEHDGIEVATDGDAFFAVFEQAGPAAEAAIAIQRAITAEDWPGRVDVRVRVGMHTGEGVLGGDDYVGVDVHRASRIAHSAHGGQVVVSGATARLLDGSLPAGAELFELGRFRLAGLNEPEPIHQLVAQGLPSEFPPLRGVSPVSRLPTPLTDFVGREDELEEGARLVEEHRVVTLTGPGGSGKTRLSIELARRVEALFEDGAFFVSLASTADPSLIPTTVLESMGIRTAPGVDPEARLLDYLADKKTVLVLDNLEQILQDAAVFVSRLVEAASGVSVIATSRAPLQVRGERQLPVPPLPVPDQEVSDVQRASEFAAVRLFAGHAAAARPGFELTDENLPSVLTLARRLDGLPLAIELAASQVRTFTPELILRRLDNRMLTTRAPDLPERQQTIVNAIGWSYDLLDTEARAVFERCSVFSGSFGLSEAEEVGSADDPGIDVLGGLVSLVENSLVHQEDGSADPRYRMLIVIKEYAYGALNAGGDAERVESHHARVYVDLAERAEGHLLTSGQAEWLERLALDHDNMRTAFDWALRHEEASTALRLVSSLWRFWQIRGHLPEARQKAETAVALPGGEPVHRAKALLALGGIRYWQGDWAETVEPYSAAMEILGEHGEERDVADAAYNMAFAVGFGGDHDHAERLLAESLEISERVGDRVGVGRAYWGLGNIAAYRSDWARVLEMVTRATEELEGEDAPFDLGWAHFMIAYGHHRQGSVARADQHLMRALDIFAEVSDFSALTLIFEGLGVNAVRNSDSIRAARLVGAAHRIKSDTGVAITDVSINQYPELDELLATESQAVRAAYDEGFAMSVDDAVEVARSS